MSDNKRHITLEPLNTGDLLSECVRAYLHGGNPSVMVSKVLTGVEEFIIEKELAVQGAEAGNRMDPIESAILDEMKSKLEQLYQEIRKLELHHYSM